MNRIAAATFFALFGAALLAVVLYPRLDLIVSGLFYKPNGGFYLADHPALVFLHHVAIRDSWYLGELLLALIPISYFIPKIRARIEPKGWLFLFLALLIGPVLVANGTFKDHWGRARPRTVQEFGGPSHFSPAIIPQADTGENGSFVSGDGAFGSYLHSIAYLVPVQNRRRSRRIFWCSLALGSAFGIARIIMGAHFFSDVLFAALFMFMTSAGVHAGLYGWRKTRDCWRTWLGIDS